MREARTAQGKSNTIRQPKVATCVAIRSNRDAAICAYSWCTQPQCIWRPELYPILGFDAHSKAKIVVTLRKCSRNALTCISLVAFVLVAYSLHDYNIINYSLWISFADINFFCCSISHEEKPGCTIGCLYSVLS